MTINVTQEDIDNGIPEDPTLCAIALAVRKVSPGHEDEVVVHSHVVWIGRELYDLPQSAAEFIRGFDCGFDSYPFTFEMTPGEL